MKRYSPASKRENLVKQPGMAHAQADRWNRDRSTLAVLILPYAAIHCCTVHQHFEELTTTKRTMQDLQTPKLKLRFQRYDQERHIKTESFRFGGHVCADTIASCTMVCVLLLCY